MSAEARLKEMSESLESSTPKTQTRYDALKVKNFLLQKAVPALFEGISICDDLVSYLDRNPQERELLVKFDSVAVDIKGLATKFDGNLRKIEGVQQGLQERISRFDLLEAKYKHMIDRVDAVLDELSRVLKQM